MNRTIWIGCHRPITIRPIVKPWTHLISPQCDITKRQTIESSCICLHYRGGCSCTCADSTTWVVLINTWARWAVIYVDISSPVSITIPQAFRHGYLLRTGLARSLCRHIFICVYYITWTFCHGYLLRKYFLVTSVDISLPVSMHTWWENGLIKIYVDM